MEDNQLKEVLETLKDEEMREKGNQELIKEQELYEKQKQRDFMEKLIIIASILIIVTLLFGVIIIKL